MAAGWINKTVEIKFAVPKVVQETMDDCERCNRENDMLYFVFADSLDVMCKNGYAAGRMSKAQWRTIERRYCNYD